MITPAYSATATERVLPRMALDFTTALLDPRVTVARALNTATRVNSNGLIETVNANLPRFDYDPVTLACKGLLIEESRQNIIPFSNAFSTQWLNAGGSIVADDAVSPAGTQTASKLTGARYRAPGLASATRTYSCFAKKLDGNHLFAIRIDTPASLTATFDLNAGAVSSVSAGMTAAIENFGDGWYRCATTLTDAAVNIVLISPNGGGASCYIWEAQAEDGAFATSIIPTNGSSLTRNADVVSMTGTNFSSWYNASEGAFAARASLFDAGSIASNPFCDALTNASNNIVLGKRVGGGGTTDFQMMVVNSGSVQAFISAASVLTANNTYYTGVGAYKADSFQAAANGVAGTPDTLGTVPTVNQLQIGSSTAVGGFLNGHMASLRYWPQRLINAEVQAFSK